MAAARFTYADFYAPLAAGLPRRWPRPASSKGDTVSALLANTPAMLEAHYGVPMAGAVLNTLNTRLDAAIIAFSLDHAETKLLIIDKEFSATDEGRARADARARSRSSSTMTIRNSRSDGRAPVGSLDYEQLHRQRRSRFRLALPDDEWDAISLNYTSGTTGNPKGVVYHHRGAYLHRAGQCADRRHAQASGLSVDAADVPLQWLVLSLVALGRRRHACDACAGCAPRRSGRRWPSTRSRICAARRSSCRRSSMRPTRRRRKLAACRRIPHRRRPAARSGAGAHGGAGFNVTHLYGLTETYGPAVVNDWNAGLGRARQPPARAAKKARQGVRYHPARGPDRDGSRDHEAACRPTARRWAKSCSAAIS